MAPGAGNELAIVWQTRWCQVVKRLVDQDSELNLYSLSYTGNQCSCCKKGKGFSYSIPSVGPGADPGVQAVSLHVTVSHPPGGRLPLLSARPAVTSSAAEHHRPLAGTKYTAW